MLTNLLATSVIALLCVYTPAHAEQTAAADFPGGVLVNESSTGVSATEPAREAVTESSTGEKTGNSEETGGSQAAKRERVLTAQLRGSLCLSCLIQLEKKLQSTSGVKSARVIRWPMKASKVDKEPSHARVEIVYRAGELNQKRIRKIIQRSDFDIRREKDEVLTEAYKPLADPS